MPRGILISISGPSGVGKRTLIEHVLISSPRCTLAVSATTRAPRPEEVDGKDYHFLSRNEFMARVARQEFIEYAEYAGNYYGTPKTEIEALMAAGENVLVELEVKGALQLMDIKELKPVSIFVLPPPPMIETLRLRLIRRGTETQERIEARLKIAVDEINQAGKFQHRIVNGDQTGAKREILTLIGSKLGVATTM